MKRTAKFVSMIFLMTANLAAGLTMEKTAMPKNAQDYIAAFNRGEDFTRPLTGLLIAGQPDGAALQVLGQELAIASPTVREKIVALLVELGLQTDPLSPKGAEVLRNQQIIELLAGSGLAKADLGRNAAIEALRKLVTPSNLGRFEEVFVKTLLSAPTEGAFLLVAKAKPRSEIELVDRLARSAKWKEVEAAKIARAALGANDVEDEYLAAAEAAPDGKAFAKALRPLGLMGTPRSLKAIAERLRTPLTIDVPGAYEKSLRLNVLEALLYNFPDQPVLYPNNILTEADYTAAERFCIRTFGVAYPNPPPPFMTYRGYPSPLPR